MEYSQEQLKDLRLEEGTQTLAFAMYPACSKVEEVVVHGIEREARDGSSKREMAIGVVVGGDIGVSFPIIDVVMYALHQHPELLERAKAELAILAENKRLHGF